MQSVLIIDDNEAMAFFYAKVIEHAGYRALVAHTGSEALTLLSETNRPALILLDFLMPEMSGEVFIRRLKEEIPELFDSVPVIGLSGLNERAPNLKVFRTLVTECVEKPGDSESLLRIVHKFIRSSSAA